MLVCPYLAVRGAARAIELSKGVWSTEAFRLTDPSGTMATRDPDRSIPYHACDEAPLGDTLVRSPWAAVREIPSRSGLSGRDVQAP